MTYDNQTIVQLLATRVTTAPQRPAIRFRRDGEWVRRDWGELFTDVGRMAAVLTHWGVGPGDRVISYAPNRYEWITLDLAIHCTAAVHVPVHATLSGRQAVYQIVDSGARVAVLSGIDEIEKLATSGDPLPDDLVLACFDRGSRSARPVIAVEDAIAEHAADAGPLPVDRLPRLDPNEMATILYTSGTTGEPKGVMLSHANLASNALATLDVFEQKPDDLRLTFLPLSHIFARTCDLYTWIACGAELALAESRETVIRDCAEVKPTLINGVPYFFDKVQRVLAEKGLADQPGVLRAAFGGRLEMCCSGGAALPDHVYDYYTSQKIPLLQGYGLTESSPVISVSTREEFRRGSSGKAIPGVEIAIADSGEILTRGPHVMLGYFRDAAATAATIRDGWLHTGDLGRVDENGFLYITGRIKEILVTSGGKNVAPVQIESLLIEDPLILQALVLGDGRDYLSALIVPDMEQLPEVLRANNIEADSMDGVLSDPRVIELFTGRVGQCLEQRVSRYEQVRRIALLASPFSIENGQLTAKLSLRREVICRDYAAEIEALYERPPVR